MRAEDLYQALDRLPRVRMAATPTPLQSFPRLAAVLDLSALFVKRDDLTGLAFGGNKVRELDFLIGDAVAAGADMVIAGGGAAQSNHARQCAAAARQAGMEPVMVLRRGAQPAPETGNLLITRLLGAKIHWIDDDPTFIDREAAAPAMDCIAEDARRDGRTPYVLRSSFHPLAACAYVEAGLELAEQLEARNVSRVNIVVTSMGATHVGLRLAAELCELDWEITAVCWKPEQPGLAEQLRTLAHRTALTLGVHTNLTERDFQTVDYGGPAYGVPNTASAAALQLAARTEALILDPVYTAKGFAGLIEERQAGRLDPAWPTVFIHTGGQPALFA